MKKKISIITVLTVLIANNFIMVSQANASFLKAGINALGKSAMVYNHQQKKEHKKINLK